MPAPVRMTYLGITSIPKPMIEAGESVRRHQTPAAVEGGAAGRPADHHGGLTQCIMLSLSMVVFAALIGAEASAIRSTRR
jgi:glycine betaine/proline transport system permease protein